MSQRPFTAGQNDPRRRSLIIGTNTKLHHTPGETVAYLRQLHARAPDALQSTSDVQLFLCPPYTSLPAAVPTAAQIDVPIWIGAQNVDGHLDGAFTGEISAPMLSALGTDLVLLGHAERRNLFGETNESLARKVQVALDSNLLIMLCVGEKADDREHRVGPETVRRQVKIALSGISADRLNRVLIAYEPVWAIGGSTPAGPEDIKPIIAEISSALDDLFGAARADVKVLYGGSVSADAVGELLDGVPDLDGFLLGRAGLTVDGLLAIVETSLRARGKLD